MLDCKHNIMLQNTENQYLQAYQQGGRIPIARLIIRCKHKLVASIKLPLWAAVRVCKGVRSYKQLIPPNYLSNYPAYCLKKIVPMSCPRYSR